MLHAALILFAIGACGGMFLAWRVLRDRSAPWAVSILHGLLGAGGIATLLVLILRGGATRVTVGALILFAVAACGGLFLASFHARKVWPPKVIVWVHAGIALSAFGTLLYAAF